MEFVERRAPPVALVDRLRDLIESQPCDLPDGSQPRSIVSRGLAACPDDGASAAALLKQVVHERDRALIDP